MSPRRFFAGLGILCLIVVAGAASAEAQALKVGVFDAQRIFEETAAGAKIQARLNALEENKRSELETEQEALRTLQNQLVTTGTSLSQEKLRELRLQIERKSFDLESMQKSASREIQLEVEEAQSAWQQRILRLVNNYGSDNGFTLIIPIGVVAYHSSATDITDELIKIVDAQDAPAGP